MKIRNLAAAALFGGAFFFIAGCESTTSPQAEDAAQYRGIAARLNTGGSYYQILNPRYVFDGADRIAVQLFNSFASMPEPPENFRDLLDGSLYMALVYRLSGIEDVQGFGASSVRISGENEPLLFRNRTYLAVRPGSRGFLWSFPAAENRNVAKAWAELPAEVDSAFEFDVRPDEVYKILAGSSTLSQFLQDERFAAFAGEPPEQLLAGIAGTVRFASIAADGSEEAVSGSHLMFSFPDRGGKLFGVMRKFSVFLPGTRVDGKRIQFGTVLGQQAPKAAPVILAEGDRITVFSSIAAEKAFTMPEKRLADSGKFRRLAEGLPSDGIGFIYNNESYARAFNLLMKEFELKFEVNPNFWTPEQLTVIAREGDGFLSTGSSSLDYNQSKLVNQLILPAAIGGMAAREYLKSTGKLLPGQKAEPQPDTTGECQITLELFKDALARYAEKHGGAYPKGENIEGIRELLKEKLLPFKATVCPGAGEDEPAESAEAFGPHNCSFIYFAGFNTKSNPKLPLVADWPFNHDGAVNVLLVDGTIRKLDLETGNCKRIVSKLQTIYQYNETDFRDLIQQADKLDKTFELD